MQNIYLRSGKSENDVLSATAVSRQCFMWVCSVLQESHKVFRQFWHLTVASVSFFSSPQRQAWHTHLLERSDSSIRFRTTKFTGRLVTGVWNGCLQTGQSTCKIRQFITSIVDRIQFSPLHYVHSIRPTTSCLLVHQKYAPRGLAY